GAHEDIGRTLTDIRAYRIQIGSDDNRVTVDGYRPAEEFGCYAVLGDELLLLRPARIYRDRISCGPVIYLKIDAVGIELHFGWQLASRRVNCKQSIVTQVRCAICRTKFHGAPVFTHRRLQLAAHGKRESDPLAIAFRRGRLIDREALFQPAGAV